MRITLRIAVRVLVVVIVFLGLALAFFALIQNSEDNESLNITQTALALSFDAHR